MRGDEAGTVVNNGVQMRMDYLLTTPMLRNGLVMTEKQRMNVSGVPISMRNCRED
jgi:hypothetical protein